MCEIHGHLMRARCSNPACSLAPDQDEATHAQQAVPMCPVCASALRPDIALFGEELPALASWTVKRARRDCDRFVGLGTSGTVTPAANCVRGAEYAGARTIDLNLEPMQPPNPAFQEHWLGRAEELLPRLLGLA